MLLDGVGIRDAVSDIGHAVEVESTDEEALDQASDLCVVVSVVSLSNDSDKCSSE